MEYAMSIVQWKEYKSPLQLRKGGTKIVTLLEREIMMDYRIEVESVYMELMVDSKSFSMETTEC
jgi:hypothetical protein